MSAQISPDELEPVIARQNEWAKLPLLEKRTAMCRHEASELRESQATMDTLASVYRESAYERTPEKACRTFGTCGKASVGESGFQQMRDTIHEMFGSVRKAVA